MRYQIGNKEKDISGGQSHKIYQMAIVHILCYVNNQIKNIYLFKSIHQNTIIAKKEGSIKNTALVGGMFVQWNNNNLKGNMCTCLDIER